MQQVAVGHVEFDHLKARHPGPAGRRQRTAPTMTSRSAVVSSSGSGMARGEGEGARRQRLPTAGLGTERRAAAPGGIGGCLAPGVGELDAGHRPLLGDEAGDGGEGRGVGVGPDAAVVGTDPPLGADGARLDHHQPGPADGPAAQMDQVPVGGQPLPARILAHGRDEDAVAEGHIAQFQRSEKPAHRPTVFIISSG